MSAAPTTRPFYWSVRRELWENRSVWIAPLAVAGLAVLAFLVTTPALPGNVRALSGPDMESAHMAVHGPYGAVALLGFATAFVVGVFYCLDALQGERRDRSILFWKSLPVSDRTIVLSKASVPLVVLPLLVLALSIAAQVVMLIVGSAVVVATGAGIGPLWRNVEPFQSGVAVLYSVIVIALWHAPIYGWLLLVSGWARRTALLWAVLPFIAVSGIEQILFGTIRFPMFMKDLLIGWVPRAFDLEGGEMADMLGMLAPGRFLSTPGLWGGLALTAVFLAAAVRIRRRREPI